MIFKMNKIKIYTSPLLKEEFDLFSKFYDKKLFYILLAADHSYSKPIECIFNNTMSFSLYSSHINYIFKENQQYHFWKLLKDVGSKNTLKYFDYSEYEKYL